MDRNHGLHGTGAGIVGGHREIPVAELVVEIFEVTGCGASGFLGVLAVVQVHIVVKAIAEATASHELPDTAGTNA